MMKVSGMKWLWLSTAMVASAACSSATDTQVDVANATAPDRVQSMLGGEEEGDDFWSDLCDTDEATGDTTCTLTDGNGTNCGLTFNADGVITEQGCEGPWGSYNCTADEETLTCDLAMGNLPGCTETFDLESLELLDSNCDFAELFPERPEHDGDHDGPGHNGPDHGDWDDEEDEDGRPDHGDWGDDHDNAPDFECFEECEDLAMAVEEECRDADQPRECFEANREEVEACFDGCHDAAGPDHGDWDDEDGHWDDEEGHWDDEEGDWGDEEECDEPDFGPGHDNACFEGCENLIEATEEECRNAENPRECFETARIDIEACFEACYQEDRPDHGDDWGHPEEGEEGDWGHPDHPDHGDDWGEPDWTCVDTCEELAYAVEEECYASEDPRACFEANHEEVQACFESCRPEPVEGEEGDEGDWGFPDEPDHGDHGDNGGDWGFPEHPEDGDHWGEPGEGEFPAGPDAACFEACEELIDIVEEECRGSERPYECFEAYRADVDACFEGCSPEGLPEIPGGF